MSAVAPATGARLTLRWVGVASCARAGLIAAAAAGVAAFLSVFVLWQVLTPGVEQGIGSAFAGSRPLLAGLLGPGTGLAVAAVAGGAAAAVVLVVAVLAPVLYRGAAARAGGVGLVLAAGE